jgi:hypothetical protein
METTTPATPPSVKPAGTTQRDWDRTLVEREITRRANAYPKLITALRDSITELRLNNVNELGEQRLNTGIDYQLRANAALLRELGEEV